MQKEKKEATLSDCFFVVVAAMKISFDDESCCILLSNICMFVVVLIWMHVYVFEVHTDRFEK